MIGRATVAGMLAGALLATVVFADAARADRLDEAGAALSRPGVWVDRDLTWLVTPQQARRLDRQIGRAQVAVRIAVLPRVQVDESRGDPRAIARAIIRRAGGDGLYVLVDQNGSVQYAARNLRLDLSESSFRTGPQLQHPPVSQALAAIVPTVRAARPAAPVSFLPFASPQGLETFHRAPDEDPLALIAAVFAIIGVILGLGLFVLLRSIVRAVDDVRARGHV
ncbi:MAG: hypothetical protein QOE11_1951 [Solirubrobacteraceae bacterium]|jgi:hypothetical protein|nr:hypothetical protein [Solirubrobacteraceae bacterium]